jgi:hypothetical protein
LIQVAERGNWLTAGYYINWLKNPKRQADILRQEIKWQRDGWMPVQHYGKRKVIWA